MKQHRRALQGRILKQARSAVIYKQKPHTNKKKYCLSRFHFKSASYIAHKLRNPLEKLEVKTRRYIPTPFARARKKQQKDDAMKKKGYGADELAGAEAGTKLFRDICVA